MEEQQEPAVAEKQGWQFSVGEAISVGWNTTMKHLGFILTVMLTMFVVQMVTSGIQGSLAEKSLPLYFIFVLVSTVINIILSTGLIKITLSILDGKPVTYTDLFSTARYIVKYLIANILIGIVVIIGLILLIIPGIYLALKYSMTNYLIVDKDMDPVAAFHRSGELTKGQIWNLIALGAVLIVINILGALPLLLGLLVTVPTSTFAMAYVYRKLQENA